MNELLLALPQSPMVLKGIYTHIPLHCTVLHWFSTNEPLDTLFREIRFVCIRHSPLLLEAGEKALFGKHQDVPVYKICKNLDLAALHMDLYQLAVELGVTFKEPQFVGAGYGPHTTTNDNESFPTGSRQWVNKVAVVQKVTHEHHGFKPYQGPQVRTQPIAFVDLE